jgi:carbamoyltransferase
MKHREVANLIANQKIVSIFQGKCEAGPRALGNRSILYDPRDSDAQKKINRIKHREWYRPFAATILFEYAHEWFEMYSLEESKFMMYAIEAKSHVIDIIPGVLHVDNTCRIQTVTEEQNYHYYHIIREFYDITGVPLIFNTSFNLAGEVMVYTEEDAISTLNRSDIDYLYFPEKSLCIS